MAVGIDKNVGLAKDTGHCSNPKRPEDTAYPIQVAVHSVVHVKIAETFGYIQKLEKIRT